MALANGMFGWVNLGVSCVISFGYIVAFFVKSNAQGSVMNDFMERAVVSYEVITASVTMLGHAIFFYWTQVLWVDMSSNCLSGYCLMDFFVWLILLLLTVGPAIIVAIGSCVCVCCFPCIIRGAKEYFNTVNE